MTIRSATPLDASAIADIYNPYIKTTTITFEEQPVSADDMASRVDAAQSAGLFWLVAETEAGVIGYAYAVKWNSRSAYRFTAEVSVYIAQSATASGVGTQLYKTLFALLKERGYQVVIGGIALPNEPSVRLHEKFGFEKVAHYKGIGFKFDTWIDVAYWQRRL